MDPFAVLGLDPTASDEEVAAAYREHARRLHPDVSDDPGAHERMARINAAYDAIRAGDGPTAALGAGAVAGAHAAAGHAPAPVSRPPGHWLSDRIRSAMAPEILAALEPYEDVRIVARATTWESPETQLAVTDRRLLWVGLWEITPRVGVLRHADVAEVRSVVRRPLRRTAVLKLAAADGTRTEFGDLDPDTAALIARNVSDGARPGHDG